MYSLQLRPTSYVNVEIPFPYDGSIRVVNATVTVTADFEYTFPSDSGVWGVDNLSAPGGPGGGWAFSYTPCPP
jgi:hypothetical protein